MVRDVVSEDLCWYFGSDLFERGFWAALMRVSTAPRLVEGPQVSAFRHAA